MAKALKALLLIISIAYLSGLISTPLLAQSKESHGSRYDGPEETDFC